MNRRTFLGIVTWAAMPGAAGLRPVLAPLDDNIVIADLNPETVLLACSGMMNGGVAVLLGLRNSNRPSEFTGAELVQFSAVGARITSAPIPSSLGLLSAAHKNIALDHNGTLWLLRPRAGAKIWELAHLEPGQSLKMFPLSYPWRPDAAVTSIICEPGLVWCAIITNLSASVLRFQVTSHVTESNTSSNVGGCYRFFPSESGYMIAAYAAISPGNNTVTSSVHALDKALKLSASASIDGWIQDIAYTPATGRAPAMLHLALTGDLFGERLIALETLALPDLRRVWIQTWNDTEKIVPGSLVFIKSNGVLQLVRMSSATLDLLSSAIEPNAQERALPLPRPAGSLHRVYPLRDGTSVRYLLDSFYRARRRIAFSPDLAAAVKG